MSRSYLVEIRNLPGERWLFTHSALYRRWRWRVAFRRTKRSLVTMTVETQRATASLLLLAESFERLKVRGR